MAAAASNLTVAFVAKLEAKDDTAEEVASLLADALELASALLENADRLLATAPEILPADVLAAKVVA